MSKDVKVLANLTVILPGADTRTRQKRVACCGCRALHSGKNFPRSRRRKERRPEPRTEVKGAVKRSGTESVAALDRRSSAGRSAWRRRHGGKFSLVSRRIFAFSPNRDKKGFESPLQPDYARAFGSTINPASRRKLSKYSAQRVIIRFLSGRWTVRL